MNLYRLVIGGLIAPAIVPLSYHFLRVVDLSHVISDRNFFQKTLSEIAIFIFASYLVFIPFGVLTVFSLIFIKKLNSIYVIIIAILYGFVLGLIFLLFLNYRKHENNIDFFSVILILSGGVLASGLTALFFCLLAGLRIRNSQTASHP